ncbi:6880_t:CDS:2 [Ambispora gerdemannii]|uniref:6880_t:CDS:1 n=1 Tax=Ambispora gerdemannii TaxID=144530 RepID=A0A9N8WJ72_9GLOM|nr:6880_t:CDS:2 [Ambispora gerdemannii]
MSRSLDEFLSKHGLKITPNPISHRTITTTRSFRAGTTIIKSYPLAAFPLPIYEKELCNQCLKNTKLQACSACKKAFYCSSICQKQAWFTQHKFTCKKRLPLKYENIVEGAELDEEMLRRVALLISPHRSGNNGLGDSKLNGLYDILPKEMNISLLIEVFEALQSHKESHPPYALFRYESIASLVVENSNSKASKDIDKLVSYLCIFGCNNFTIHDEQMFGIGEGTYPIGSLFNHSCHPNAVVMYDGVVQIVKCIEDIDAGDEITIAYLDVVHPRRKRREILREKYFFNCHCRKCGDDDKIIVVASLFYELEKKQEWNEAAKVGKIVLAIYLIAYPRFHPMIGWQLFRLGQCMSQCVKDDVDRGGKTREETLIILKHAKRVLAITFGTEIENREVENEIHLLILQMTKLQFQ